MESNSQHNLSDLPNIGKTLAEKLVKIGINNSIDLKIKGSEAAIISISTLENNGVCLNMLYALDGAIQGVRWHYLTKERKEELKQFYNQLQKK